MNGRDLDSSKPLLKKDPVARGNRCISHTSRILAIIPLVGFLTFILISTSRTTLAPTAAKRIENTITIHGTRVVDHYAWMKNASDPDLAKYISEENKFTEKHLGETSRLRKSIANELKSFKLTRSSPGQCPQWWEGSYPPEVFWRTDSHVYWLTNSTYFRRNIDPETLCGCLITPTSQSVAVPVLSIPDGFGVFEANPSNPNLIAYTIDPTGNERFDLYIKNLATDVPLFGPFEDAYYSVRWMRHDDGDWVYFNTVDINLGVPNRVFRVCVTGLCATGKQLGLKELVYIEDDPRFIVEVESTAFNDHIIIKPSTQTTSEARLIRNKFKIPTPLFERTEGYQYFVDIHPSSDSLYILTNLGQVASSPPYNRHIVCFPLPATFDGVFSHFALSKYLTADHIILPHAEDLYIEKMELHENQLVAWAWRNGLRGAVIIDLTTGSLKEVQLGGQDKNAPYAVFPGTTDDIDARYIRNPKSACLLFTNSSFAVPPSTYVLDMNTTQAFPLASSLKISDPDGDYITERLRTTDGGVPISVAYIRYHTDDPHQIKSRPAFVVAYGAYGGFQDPAFNPTLLPLLRRGFLVATCHPRGDGDLGARWYENGKGSLKQNTFEDVRRCLEDLVERGYTKAGRIVFKGRSAGGLVAGTVAERYAGLVRAVVAQVPFVDPVADMIDVSVPWTAYEWDEWGDPVNNRTIFEAMLDYSPYHNIERFLDASGSVPDVYVTAGIEDSRVPYWEPAKYVARLRNWISERSGGGGRMGRVFLRVLEGGHFGGGDVDEETAEIFAFILVSLGMERA
ncbi:prolyl oligopeptidase family-domain-containing protein [Cladochytrium replicatum]|nr:prolyl oligopeptidase family-domain-containing protein [Cladochytrium replicatum]